MSGDYSNSVESEEDDNSFDFKFAVPPELELKQHARTYLNWRKSRKIKYLPQFFAQCEASLIEN